jgi:hypothetical protein
LALRVDQVERTFARVAVVERSLELENLRRSLAMLRPGANASLSREEAIRLITEVADLQARLERLRVGLRRLVDESNNPPGP